MEINLDNCFTIGEAARFTGVSIRMLRHYDKIGLVKPLYVDPDNQYRYYSEEQILIISFIKEMRYLNFKFSDIETFLKMADHSGGKDFLKNKLTVIENELKKLSNSQKRLKDFIHQYESIYPFYQSNAENPVIQVKELEERLVAFIRKPTCLSVKDFILRFAELQELVVSKQLEIIGPYMAVFHTDYKKLKDNGSEGDIEFCVSVNSDKPGQKFLRKVTEGYYLSAVYDDTDNTRMTDKIYSELFDIIHAKNYTVTGAMMKQYFYRRQLSGYTHKAVSEIQIPIEKP